MREVSVHEWFDLLDREPPRDIDVIRLLFSSLDGYQQQLATPEDMVQMVNLFSAIRLHQLKHTRLRGE